MRAREYPCLTEAWIFAWHQSLYATCIKVLEEPYRSTNRFTSVQSPILKAPPATPVYRPYLILVPYKVSVLAQNIYGTPDASRIYADGLHVLLISQRYKKSQADPCMFTLVDEHGLTILTITIDDFLVAVESETAYAAVMATLRERYVVKDLGTVSKILNWTVLL